MITAIAFWPAEYVATAAALAVVSLLYASVWLALRLNRRARARRWGKKPRRRSARA